MFHELLYIGFIKYCNSIVFSEHVYNYTYIDGGFLVVKWARSNDAGVQL